MLKISLITISNQTRQLRLILACLFFCPFISGCGVVWITLGTGVVSTTKPAYEYLYFGDQNIQILPGFSINTSSGVLTPIPNTPTPPGATNFLSLDKISNSFQILSSFGANAAYRIDPSTGILNAVSDAFFTSQAVLFSPSGLYAYDAQGSHVWVASVSPATGDIYNSVQTNLTAPATNSWNLAQSPDGNYIIVIDAGDNAIETLSTAGGALNIVTGANSGTGVNAGDVTYGITNLYVPNPGSYANFSAYVDAAAGALYLYYTGSTNAQNNWIMPFKINADGSLTTGTPINTGTNVPLGDNGSIVGDSQGKYLFVSVPMGSLNPGGINTYSIGVNGNLTYLSNANPSRFNQLVINANNSLLIGTGNGITTMSLNMATGNLTLVSGIGAINSGALALDPSEHFVYYVNNGLPSNIYGYTISSSGVLGSIVGQSYPLPIPGAQSIESSQVVKISSP